MQALTVWLSLEGWATDIKVLLGITSVLMQVLVLSVIANATVKYIYWYVYVCIYE